MSTRITHHATLLAITVASLCVVAGCATMRVNSYLERGADLRRLHSYAWAAPDTWSTGDPRLDNNQIFDAHVRAQVDRELSRRGFVKAASGDPELLVHYHASVSQEVDVRELDGSTTYCLERDCRPFIYDKGTLFIDLVEARTHTLMWRGWAEGSIDGLVDNQAWMEAQIDRAATKILDRLSVDLQARR